MLLNEDARKWGNLIKEELGVTDQNKLNWMSKYAQNHAIYEGLQNTNPDAGIFTTPLNTVGMGNPLMPQSGNYNAGGDGSGIGNTGANFHSPVYQRGSGDVPMSTLSIALELAAKTIALELVPVIPSPGPWAMLQYIDFPYAGGKLGLINETSLDGKGEGDSNKPIYVKVSASIPQLKPFYENKDLNPGNEIHFHCEEGDMVGAVLKGTYIGRSRIDNGIIIKVIDCKDKDDKDCSIADVFSGREVTVGTPGLSPDLNLTNARPDLVAAAADHVQQFSNFFDGSEDPMTRAQNETGVGNTIGSRFFSKMVQMGSYEVTGSVTRQQLQDMPMYGIDVVGRVIEAMQNELSQAINNRILDRLFKLGTTNAVNQKAIQGVDLNLYIAGADGEQTKKLKDFSSASKFIGIDNENAAIGWGDVKNAIQNTAAENVWTHQRRISSRVLAAANLITNVSRFGRPQWIVTNTQILSALQDSSGFVAAPMANTLEQDGSRGLYFAGSLAGLSVYVEPNMRWDDTRILVGRKSDGQQPGVVFMPYILADTVQILAEGTLAPKMMINSRFAIVDAGFHPEQQYITFMVDTAENMIL